MDMNQRIFYIDINMAVLAGLIFASSYFVHSHYQRTYKVRMMKGLVFPAAYTVCLDMTLSLWATFKDHFRESVDSGEPTDLSLIAFITTELETYVNSVLD